MASGSGCSPPPAASIHSGPEQSPTARSSKAIVRAPSDPPSEFSSWHDDASSSRATLSAGDRTITVNTQRTRMGEHLKGKLQGMIRQRFDNYLQIIQTLQNDTGKLATLTCEIRVPGDHSVEPRARTSISCNENGTFLVYLLPDAGDLVGMGPGFSRGSSSSSPSGSAGASPDIQPTDEPDSLLVEEGGDEVVEVASSPAAPANGERELLRRWVTRVCEFGMSGNCHSLTALFRFGYLAWKDWLGNGRPDQDYVSGRYSEEEERWDRDEDSNMGSASLLAPQCAADYYSAAEVPPSPNGESSFVPLAEPRPILEVQKHPSMTPLLPMSPRPAPSSQPQSEGSRPTSIGIGMGIGPPSSLTAAAAEAAAAASTAQARVAAAAAAADPRCSGTSSASPDNSNINNSNNSSHNNLLSNSAAASPGASGPASVTSLAAAGPSSPAATASLSASATSPPPPAAAAVATAATTAAAAAAALVGTSSSSSAAAAVHSDFRDVSGNDLEGFGEGASASQALIARLKAAKRAMQQNRAEEALGLCTEGLSLAEHVGLHPLLHIGQRSRSSSLNSCGYPPNSGGGATNGCSYNNSSGGGNSNANNNTNNSSSHSYGHHGYGGNNNYGSSSSSYAIGASASSSSGAYPAVQRHPWRPPLSFRENEESGGEIVLRFLELRTSINASQHRFADALSDARELVELQPTMAEGHYWQYVALQGLHRGPEALEALTNALQYDPQNPKYSQLFSELFEHVRAQEGRCDSPRSTSRRSTGTMEVAAGGSLPSSVAVAEVPTPVVLHRRRPGGSWSRGGGAPRDALSTTTQATHLSSRSTTPTEVSEPLSPHSSSNDSLSAAGARFEDTA
eukprot:CAMPEP_0206583336 /NCGR_PEP_ID=MMETSP0325_2-20121206/35042_1 /ASSEMBLY_ACC=CAM_ASM_000347 /TAXON_ID=2866 /ORGANISM="Crypthecodinium cohnii, Strain Seligo" /LENGTH=850 /DNA_ID=CAMNT_0054090235 /DNA_START=63 /DNA_END=2615 /DNA_ORIENTATION=+